MARADILNIMYSKEKSPLEFNFDSLWMPSMYNYLTVQDIESLRLIATSNRYAAKIELKYKAIDDIMVRRGFRKFHCGTNRIVYKYLEDESFLAKIALDKVGMTDNPREYKNQFLLKPFVTRMFEHSPCGTVAFVERVQPITSREEFASIGGDIYEMLINCIIGKYVLEDIGTKYFMNYGLRNGMGPVLLDTPYVYELDGNKLYCNKVYPNGYRCDGEIDYDDGFNNLICKKCGKLYLAQELEKAIEDKLILTKEEGEVEMKIQITRGNQTLINHDSSMETENIVRRPKTMQPPRNLQVYVNDKDMTPKREEKSYKGNNKTRDYKKTYENNKNKDNGKDFKKDVNKASNSNKFQNRKDNKNTSRLDKFNTPKPNLDTELAEKLKKEQEEKELEKARQEVLKSAIERGNKIADEMLEQQKVESSILEAYGLSEGDFDEPEIEDEIVENKELDNKSILDEY